MKPLLRFKGVALRRGGRLLFEGMDLTLAPGEMLHVAGPNGSGKSSLIRLAAGLLQAERGTSSARRSASPTTISRSTASCRSAARCASGRPDRRGDGCARACRAGRVPVRLLSSGQAKRAALARVAASGTPLWLLDEPLNGLDSESAEQLARVVKAHIATGGAVLAASHQPLPGKWRMLELGQ